MAKTGKRIRALVDSGKFIKTKTLPMDDALAMLVGGSGVKFDETVEVALHLGVDPKKSDQAVRGACVLPAGTGKTVRVAVVTSTEEGKQAALAAGAEKVGFEDLIEEIKEGKTDFDTLIATPSVMRQLAAVGKILGPRQLMPNPKDGTVTDDLAVAVQKAISGQVRFRAEKSGIVHAPVGKTSFSTADLKRNIESFIDSLKRAKPATSKGLYLRRLSLSTSMGLSLRVDMSSYR